jgi:hypothetical protein
MTDKDKSKKKKRQEPLFRGDEAIFPSDTPLVRESDILADLTEEKATSLFLGRYSMTEVTAVLGKRNFFREAQKRDLWPLAFDLDSSGYPVQRLQIFRQAKKPENLVVDLKIREGRLAPNCRPIHLDPSFFKLDFLILEWLTIQNPLLEFSAKRPPLPGQKHPGLGLGKKVVDLFVNLARLLQKDGLLAFPAYFHNALLFSRYFHFLNPEKAAEITAIEKAFPRIPFKHLAWIVYLNCLKLENGETYEWKAEELIYPLSKGLKEYFDSRAYKKRLKQGLKGRSYAIDWDGYERKLDELIKIRLTGKK